MPACIWSGSGTTVIMFIPLSVNHIKTLILMKRPSFIHRESLKDVEEQRKHSSDYV